MYKFYWDYTRNRNERHRMRRIRTQLEQQERYIRYSAQSDSGKEIDRKPCVSWIVTWKDSFQICGATILKTKTTQEYT